MPEFDFYTKLNDTTSPIASTLEDANGDAVDIEGATIKFKMQPIAGGTLAINADATNRQLTDGTDGSKGQVLYSWATVATTAGVYLGEWEIHYANGSVQSFPNDRYLLIGLTQDLPA